MILGSKILNKVFTIIGVATLGVLFLPRVCVKADFVAGENPLAGASVILNNMYLNLCVESEELELLRAQIPDNLGIVNVSTSLNIRKGPGTNYDICGFIPKNGACLIEDVNNGWARITSGNVKGYCSTEYLLIGEEARKKAESLYVLYAVVKDDVSGNLNVRSTPQTSGNNIITQVQKGESMCVSRRLVKDKDGKAQEWVEVFLADETNEKSFGYVAREYVDLEYKLLWAEFNSPYGKGVSQLRTDICDYAKKFIGTKYVWGGNDLYNGIDCSGFVKKVYANFGYTTPRVSRDMAKTYKKISKSELLPGDLVFYGNISTNYINHVAMYIGNDQIIHSSTNYKGIAISSMYFYTIISYGRIIDD